MNLKSKNLKISVGVIIVLILVIISVMYGLPYVEKYRVKNVIEKANFCETKDDCVQIVGKCPFDCYVHVNKKHEEEVKNLLENFTSNCIYSCVQKVEYDCVRGKCMGKMNNGSDRKEACADYNVGLCPSECVVCPPCPECSSISCNTEDFCAEMDIGPDWYENMKNKITNFKECVKAGNSVMESYPRQCRVGEQTFIENIGNELEKMDLIRIDNPRPNQEIESPLTIEGEARGTWFFEADFPVILVNWDGLIIAEGVATAQDDWMTEDFVKFKAELNFEKPDYKNNGALILKKDNPSGLPENDDALEIPIIFK